MAYIVSQEIDQSTHLKRIKVYRGGGALVDIEDKVLASIKGLEHQIEPNFMIELHPIDVDYVFSVLKHIQNIGIVCIGEYNTSPWITNYYEIGSGKSSYQSMQTLDIPIIYCYSNKKNLYISDYIECIELMGKVSQELGIELVVIQNTRARENYFEEHSIAHSICKAYINYFNLSFIDYKLGYFNLMHKIRRLENKASLYAIKEPNCLFKDSFYQRIQKEQKLYVLLSNTYIKNYNQSTSLIEVDDAPMLLYAPKSSVDKLNLKDAAYSHYDVGILSPLVIQPDTSIDSRLDSKVSLKYRGRGVYFGIIGTEGIDYTRTNLINTKGESKIAYIWKQKEGDKGITYTKAMLTKAINIKQSLEYQGKTESTETMLAETLGQVIEAEFMVATINKAPKELCEIYSSNCDTHSVLMEDVIIAIDQMIHLAQRENKPIVINIPYEIHCLSPECFSAYKEILDGLAKKEGVSLIMPLGDEGDKKHHFSFNEKEAKWELYSKYKVERLQGLICLDIGNYFIRLYKNKSSHQVVNLAGTSDLPYELEGMKVYSTGLIEDKEEGKMYIRFSLEGFKGEATIHISNNSPVDAYIGEFYIGERRHNEEVIVTPSTAINTASLLSLVPHSLAVKSYDFEKQVVLKSSGKREKRVEKNVIAGEGRMEVKIEDSLLKLEGTLISTLQVGMLIACYYEKWQKEREDYLPNGFYISQLIKKQMAKCTLGSFNELTSYILEQPII